VFEGMRAALATSNIATAQTALHPSMRSKWQSFWTSLGSDLPSVSASLGEVVNGQISPFFANMMIARPIAGQPGRFNGGYLQFERGRDGVWRITNM
jgi:hypothetical protein